jgi:lipopolysaccharide export system permease protein
MEPRGPHSRDLSERYLHELLNPDLTRQWDRRNIDRLYAEAHDRLSSPLYNLALALIPFVAVACGTYNRRGYAGRVALAMGAAVAVRLAGFGIQAIAATTPGLSALLYVVPVGTILVCLMIIAGVFPSWARNPVAHPDDFSAEGA